MSVCQPCIDAIAVEQRERAVAKAQQETNRLPTERDHCFIVRGDDRRGPYLLTQIRTMWRNGSITADSSCLGRPRRSSSYRSARQRARI